jgi:anti-anti-sigma factor
MPDLFGVPRLFITNSGAVSSLEVAGELDVATAGALRDHLALLVEYGTGDVDIDMAGVTFCDAATLTVLVATRQQLERIGRDLHVLAVSRPVERLLELTSLNTILLNSVESPDPSISRRPPDRCATARTRPQVDSSSMTEGVRDVDRQARERLVG